MSNPFKRALPQHRPQAPITDRYLDAGLEVVRYVHDHLDKITAVADHLTPVEDLVDFQDQIAALHLNLGTLVEASNLLLSASATGLALLNAVDAAAMRLLLGLGSSALRDDAYFATATEFVTARDELLLRMGAVETDTAALSAALGLVQTDVAGLRNDVDTLQTNLAGTSGNGAQNAADIALLRDDLAAQQASLMDLVADVAALNAAVVALQEWKALIEVRDYDGQLGAMSLRIDTHDDEFAARVEAHSVLAARVTQTENGITVQGSITDSLTAEIVNLKTGATTNANAIDALVVLSSQHGDTLEAHSFKFTGVDASIENLVLGQSSNAQAWNLLEAKVLTNEAGQQATANDLSQLHLQVDDAVNNVSANALAISNMGLEITATKDGVTILGEDITRLNGRVGSSGNLIPNADFATDARGWEWVGVPVWAGATLGIDATMALLPAGTTALHLAGSGVPTDGTGGAVGVRTLPRIPVEGGSHCIPSAYLAGNGCTARLEYRVYSADGAVMDQDVIGQATGLPASNNLVDWPRVFSKLVLPLGAAELELVAWADMATTASPSAWLLRPMLEQVDPTQEGPSFWMPGSERQNTALAEAVQGIQIKIDQTDEELDILSNSFTALSAEFEGVEQDAAANSEALDTLAARVTVNEDGITTLAENSLALESSLTTQINDERLARQQAIVNAQELIGQITDDSLISADEKPGLIRELEILLAEQPGILLEAEASELTEEVTNYNTAIDNLQNYLATLTSPVKWDNTSSYTVLQ